MPDKPAQDSVMPLQLAKRMLSMAESEPLGCAFGLTKDKKESMLLIQKFGSGRKIAAKLREDGKDLALDPKTVRFGTVGFQLPDDPGTIRFTVNRSEAGGTIMSLTRFARKAGYQGIVINVDPELDEEPEEQDTTDVPPAPPPPPSASRPDAGELAAELAVLARRIPEAAGSSPDVKARLLKLATDTNVNIKTNNLNDAKRFLGELRDAMRDALEAAGVGIGQVTPGSGAPPQERQASASPDMRRLSGELATLIRRIPEVTDPASKTALMRSASEASASVKAGDPAQATQRIDKLREDLRDALDAAGVGIGNVTGKPQPLPDQPPPGLSLVALAKSRLGWRSERLHAIAEIGRLKARIAERFADDETQAQALDVALKRLDRLVAEFGPALDDGLDEVLGADAAARPELVAAARAQMTKFLATIDGDEIMSELDGNEILPDMSVTQPLRQALDKISAALG